MANTRSRDRNREPRGQNIVSGILVAVVLYLATGTSPISHVKRQSLNDVTTSRTCFAAGIEAVDLDQLPTIPLAFVSEADQEHAPSSVRYYSGEAMVANHPSDIQILDNDHLIFANEASGEFVHLVAATVGHLGAQASKLDSSFVPAPGSFLFARDGARESPFFGQFSGVVFEVGNLLSCRQSGQCIDAKIYADCCFKFGQGLDGLVLTEQGNVPALSCIERHRYAGWFDVHRKRATPVNVKRRIHLGQGKLVVNESKPTTSELGRASGSLLFETWILCSLGKEVRVGGLQMSQGLLDWNARHFVQKSQLGFFLPTCKRRTLSCIPNGFLAQRPRFAASMQRSIIDEPTTSNRSTKQNFLLGGWIKTVFESSQRHPCRIANISVKSTNAAASSRFLLSLKEEVSAWRNR